MVEILYEYKKKYRKVKFCYGCRTLKNKEDGFYSWYEMGKLQKEKYKKVSHLCRRCKSIKNSNKYKLIN